MPRNQEKKATRYFNRRNQNRLFFLKEIEQAIRKKKNSTSEKDENSKENEKGTKWTDVAGLIVNAILAVFTGLLFWIALDQKQDVRKSSQAAIDAVNESRKANITSDSNYQLSKQSFESGNVDAQKRFKFDSNIIKQQIDYLKLTHNDFLL
jgi:cytoskeletal protein RodZ